MYQEVGGPAPPKKSPHTRARMHAHTYRILSDIRAVGHLAPVNSDTTPLYTTPMVKPIIRFLPLKVNKNGSIYSRFITIFTIFTNKIVIFGQIIQTILAIFK